MDFKYFQNNFFVLIGLIIALFVNLGFGKTPSLWVLRDVVDGYQCINVPQCVSSDGSIVAGGAHTLQAATWQNGSLKRLGNLLGPGMAGDSFARGISSNGSIVVGNSPSNSWASEAYMYKNGVMTGLGVLPEGSFSVAFDVSSDGNVIVGYSSSSSGLQAFRWENNIMVGLGYLPGFTKESRSNAVSGNGTIVVGYSKSDGGAMKAFRWENGFMTDLGSLPGGGNYVVASSISANGSVIVGSSDSNSGTKAFRWENGVMRDLGFPPEITFSRATAVSGNGSIIVGEYSDGGCGGSQAFVWDEKHGWRNLEYVLGMEYGIGVGGWCLWSANAISDDGTTIVGVGTNPHGDDQGWIAVINSCSAKITEDLNNDCTVNFEDFAIFASHWLVQNN